MRTNNPNIRNKFAKFYSSATKLTKINTRNIYKQDLGLKCLKHFIFKLDYYMKQW